MSSDNILDKVKKLRELTGVGFKDCKIALDENKNQPIAVPRESFAGQSSVGRKLLSPLSPESQNDEKELQEKSLLKID